MWRFQHLLKAACAVKGVQQISPTGGGAQEKEAWSGRLEAS